MIKSPTQKQVSSARARFGMTQHEAATILGVARVTWARYETGERVMPAVKWAYWQHIIGLHQLKPIPPR